MPGINILYLLDVYREFRIYTMSISKIRLTRRHDSKPVSDIYKESLALAQESAESSLSPTLAGGFRCQ